MWGDVMEEEEKEVEQVVSVNDIAPACFKAPVVRAVAVESPEEGGGRNSSLSGCCTEASTGKKYTALSIQTRRYASTSRAMASKSESTIPAQISSWREASG